MCSARFHTIYNETASFHDTQGQATRHECGCVQKSDAAWRGLGAHSSTAMAQQHTRNRWFLMRHGEVLATSSRSQRTHLQRRAFLTPRDSFAARSPKVASSRSARSLISTAGEDVRNGLSEKGREEARRSAQQFISTHKSSLPLQYVAGDLAIAPAHTY